MRRVILILAVFLGMLIVLAVESFWGSPGETIFQVMERQQQLRQTPQEK